MASIRTVDFAIVLVGAVKGGPVSRMVTEPEFEIDTGPYEAAKRSRPEPRTLVRIAGNAGPDIKDHVQQLMNIILGKTGKNLNTIGSCCIIGTSNSSSSVMALAARLKTEAAPRLNYVGVIDVTFIPAGRDPPVPLGIGELKPYNRPETGLIDRHLGTYRLNPTVSGLPPHIVVEPSLIDAQRLCNFYQTEGNHVKLWRKTPSGRSWDWWWSPYMASDEVHGEIDGWENQRFVTWSATPFLGDRVRHDHICKRMDSGWGAMVKEAAEALAQLPP